MAAKLRFFKHLTKATTDLIDIVKNGGFAASSWMAATIVLFKPMMSSKKHDPKDAATIIKGLYVVTVPDLRVLGL